MFYTNNNTADCQRNYREERGIVNDSVACGILDTPPSEVL